jgi:hypothetical protein
MEKNVHCLTAAKITELFVSKVESNMREIK